MDTSERERLQMRLWRPQTHSPRPQRLVRSSSIYSAPPALSRCSLIRGTTSTSRPARRKPSHGCWILYILTGIERTSRSTLRKIEDIRSLQDDFNKRAREASKGGSNSELQLILFEQPYCRIKTVVERCKVSRPTATAWLQDLVTAGLLQDLKIGRDRLFINREFLKLLVRTEPTG
ncbi:hypothetical protein ACQPXH_26435 [Nocardia sp. CA-135953]|uniref:hypothetical protein n=1 Tax=Nocardia sp. CA-135953 TaxID=3239978 RepID=UPI003D9955FB